jgi:hypothetical protein
MLSNASLGRGLRYAAVAIVAVVCVGFGQSQDPSLKPEFGAKELKAGFEPDPVVIDVKAGGDIKTKIGGFEHWVKKAPTYRLKYTAGQYVLSIYAESDADTTLLINLPDGKWIANDDAPNGGNNPLLVFNPPQSGVYDIYVGTFEDPGKDLPSAKLCITEKKK